jgi:type I restriction enzyme S subunit
MNAVTKLLTDHMDIWTAADTEKKSGRGRSAAGSGSVYGIKKLRELILELAVRGKLVPQDPNDEPSNQLLKRIEIERAHLRKNGSIKPEKPYPRIDTKEAPFPVPDGWIWVNLAQVGHDWGQTTPEGQFTYIEVSAIDSNLGIVSSPEVVEANDAPSRARKIVRSGTVIYSTVRPYLRNIAVIEDDFSPSPIASTAFAVIHPFCEMPPRYILAYLRSPPFVRYVESVQTGIAYPAINDKQFFSGLFPLPPLAEQHRIVAKVDELMALCDHLEAGQAGAAEAHENLVTQLLGTLTASENPKDFTANWQRIAAHFDTLFTTETSIDALKQTILQLAVIGKLVPHDPNDEPASELVNKIIHSKTLLVKGSRKNVVDGSKLVLKTKPFELPPSWEWVRLGDIAVKITDGTHHTPTYVEKGVPFLSVKDMSGGELDFSATKFITADEHETLRKRCNPEKGDLLLTKIGTTGVPVVIDTDVPFSIFVSVALIKLPWEHISVTYLKFLISAPFVKAQSAAGTEGVGNKNLVLRKIEDFLLAIPPLAEQHRIVAKVYDLMSVCDQLKACLSDANRVQQTLADALVKQAVA